MIAVWALSAVLTAPALEHGLSEYANARSESVLQLTYFGGLVHWTIRGVRLAPENVIRSRDGRAFLTLERYLGKPALQRGLAAAEEASRSQPLSQKEFFGLLGNVVGQDLMWFSHAVFDDGGPIDYAIDSMTSVAAADCGFEPCIRTSVGDRRTGTPFTGSSREPVGPYEEGRAIVVETTFEDGTVSRDSWDGRSETMSFTYLTRAPAVKAEVDPDHVLVLDESKTNNSRTAAPRTAAAANRWSARWMLWLQNVVLSYAALA
jgi:hypothetical protein